MSPGDRAMRALSRLLGRCGGVYTCEHAVCDAEFRCAQPRGHTDSHRAAHDIPSGPHRHARAQHRATPTDPSGTGEGTDPS